MSRWSASTLVTMAASGATASGRSRRSRPPRPRRVSPLPSAAPRPVAARMPPMAYGVGAAGPQDRGEHGGGGGLAVRARHRDAPLAEHHRGQRGRPVQHPQAALRGPRRARGCPAGSRWRPPGCPRRRGWPRRARRAPRAPRRGQLVEHGHGGRVAAGHRHARASMIRAMPDMPAPPMPVKCTRPSWPRGTGSSGLPGPCRHPLLRHDRAQRGTATCRRLPPPGARGSSYRPSGACGPSYHPPGCPAGSSYRPGGGYPGPGGRGSSYPAGAWYPAPGSRGSSYRPGSAYPAPGGTAGSSYPAARPPPCRPRPSP